MEVSKEKYIDLSKKYKITPRDSSNAFGGTIITNNLTETASNGSGGGTGGNFIFFL